MVQCGIPREHHGIEAGTHVGNGLTGNPPPNGLLVILLKRTALCSFCKFLEALNVGLVE